MSNIKLDPETKFKWPEYDGDPFTEKEDDKTRVLFSKQSSDVLNKLLSSVGIQECSGKIPMSVGLRYRTSPTISRITPLFGTYKESDLEPKIALMDYDESQKKYLRMMIKHTFGKIWEKYPFETIKQKFRECTGSNLFVIHVIVMPLSDIYEVPFHANMLVIAKNRGVVYWIEPQAEPGDSQVYTKELSNSIKRLVEDLGMPDPTIVNPVEVCPQAITNDENCMFWTYIIFMLILLNPQERDHNKLVKQFLEKYPTKEALTRYVDGFKRTFLDMFPAPAQAGKGRTYKRRVVKKRKTYRRKRPTSRTSAQRA
jgi:hypothetical protein